MSIIQLIRLYLSSKNTEAHGIFSGLPKNANQNVQQLHSRTTQVLLGSTSIVFLFLMHLVSHTVHGMSQQHGNNVLKRDGDGKD